MRVAIIGAGITGNVAAWALSKTADVVVYEKNNRIGGHSHTVTIDYDGEAISVDTGFIVFNPTAYPNLSALFEYLGVEKSPVEMGFSVSVDDGAFEWRGGGHNLLNGIFAQRRNLTNPKFIKMLFEVLRFNRTAISALASDRIEKASISNYLAARHFSPFFFDRYLGPGASAIWSIPPDEIRNFPAKEFISFYLNHGLLDATAPAWYTVRGGSREYVSRLVSSFRDRIRLGVAVTKVARDGDGLTVTDSTGRTERYDHVVAACHTDDIASFLIDATADEKTILDGVHYRPNRVYLHRDPSFMPTRARAWAAWNYQEKLLDSRRVGTTTYWMNPIQSISSSRALFVTVNPPVPPKSSLVFAEFDYAHPQFDDRAFAAQKRLKDQQGRDRVWMCGAWTGFGFHEDGLNSGLRVAEALGGHFPWRVA